MQLSSRGALGKVIRSTLALVCIIDVGMALAQSSPAPVQGSAQAKPMAVTVVCLGKDKSTLLDNRDGLRGLLDSRQGDSYDAVQQVGGWSYLPLGTGFVIGEERRYVVTSWHLQAYCPLREDGSQIGILDPAGKDFRPILATLNDHYLDPNKKNSEGQPLKVSVAPRKICENDVKECAYWKDVGGYVNHFVPDLAILQLAEPSSQMPFVLEENPQLTAGQSLSFQGFPGIASKSSDAVGNTARSKATVPTTSTGSSSREVLLTNEAPGVVDTVKATVFELNGSVNPGYSGGPVIVGDRVVGINSVTEDALALVIPSNDLVALLEKLGVPYRLGKAAPVAATIDAPQTTAVSDEPAWKKFLVPLLAVIVVLSGGAFFVISRKPAARPLPPVPPQPTNDATSGMGPKSVVAGGEIQGTYGGHASHVFPLPAPNGSTSLIFGRDAGTCQVVFPANSTNVSKLHCRITWDGNNRCLFLEDMNSTNGTFVNKQPIVAGQPKRLAQGDVLHLGGKDSMDVFKIVYKSN